MNKRSFLQKNKGLIFIAPWIIGFLVFLLGPLIASIFLSMTDMGIKNTTEGFIGIDNYIEALKSSEFYDVLWVTIKYTIFAVPLGMISGFTAALLLNLKLNHLGIFRAIYYIPVISSGVAIAVMWQWILAPNGLLNDFLGVFGIDPIFWLDDPTYVIPSYVIIATWGAFSGYLTYLVAIKDIPETLYDSAKLSGVGPVSVLFRITLPLMKPIITYNLILAIIAGFRKFSEAYILGGAGGQGKFYMVYFYEQAFDFGRVGYATALAWILVVIVMLLIAIIYKQTPFWSYYSGVTKKKNKKDGK